MSSPSSSPSSRFSKDDKSELILRIKPTDDSSPTDFYVEKLYLSAACVVFRDMLQTASSEQSGMKDGLPVVVVDDKVKDLALLLEHVVPGKMRIEKLLTLEEAEGYVVSAQSLLSPCLDRLEAYQPWRYPFRLIAISDKYDAFFPRALAFTQLLRLAQDNPELCFGLGVAYGYLPLAREALSHFGHTHKWDVRVFAHQSIVFASGRPRLLNSVPQRLLARFPAPAVLNFIRLQDSVPLKGWTTWKEVATDFEVRLPYWTSGWSRADIIVL
jgi:hypothetical protein